MEGWKAILNRINDWTNENGHNVNMSKYCPKETRDVKVHHVLTTITIPSIDSSGNILKPLYQTKVNVKQRIGLVSPKD